MELDRKKVGYIVGAVALLGFCSSLMRAPMPKQENKPEPAASAIPPAPDPTCVLSIPQSADPVLLFPTEEGADEFTSAAVRGDKDAMAVARRANAGFFAEKGTKCLWLDVGLTRTKVRVTVGPHAGKAGWVPTEWARGAL